MVQFYLHFWQLPLATIGMMKRGICRKSLEAEKPGCSPGSLNGDQSQHSGCGSGGRDVLDIVSVGFAKGLEMEESWPGLLSGVH